MNAHVKGENIFRRVGIYINIFSGDREIKFPILQNSIEKISHWDRFKGINSY
jgi:hypothetical protein